MYTVHTRPTCRQIRSNTSSAYEIRTKLIYIQDELLYVPRSNDDDDDEGLIIKYRYIFGTKPVTVTLPHPYLVRRQCLGD